MTIGDVIDLFNERARLDLHEKDIEFLYAMSMMTVPNENNSKNRYEMLALPEFLELLGRAADFKFAGSEMEEFTLAQKIEYLLDLLFVPFDFVRNLVVEDREERSESDSDY